jgi:maleate isomerase
MSDVLGWRRKFGLLVPSTNTSVQPEMEAMRPPGVTLHTARIHIPDDPVASDADFERLIARIEAATMDAVDRAATCGPDAIVLGISAESFWEGTDGSAALKAEIEGRAGVPAHLASDGLLAALEALGGARRIAVLTPYMPVGDERVRRFFGQCGIEVVRVTGLRSPSPQQAAHIPEAALRDAVAALDGPEVEAIVQVGTNLAFARVAAMAEFWLGKPVICATTATFWHALRRSGIADPVAGFGALLERH